MIMLALAGLAELTRAESILFIVLVALSFTFLPVSAYKTALQIGYADYFQIPLILIAILLAWSISRKRKVRLGKTALILFGTYIASNVVTNAAILIIRIMSR